MENTTVGNAPSTFVNSLAKEDVLTKTKAGAHAAVKTTSAYISANPLMSVGIVVLAGFLLTRIFRS